MSRNMHTDRLISHEGQYNVLTKVNTSKLSKNRIIYILKNNSSDKCFLSCNTCH